jgi:hypothetical protein
MSNFVKLLTIFGNCDNIGKNKTNLIESKQLDVLTNKGDCVFHRDANLKRIQCPKITLEEYKKIKQDK